MTDLDREQIGSISTALARICDAMERECSEGRHIDLATTRQHIKQLRLASRLLWLLREEKPCKHK
ncbi:hypothetical protein [Billgrantia ethanolica]|uniref:Uncharacterized protein n=1 Tax=Billgrantia ethanolica TaxID=2733486 RepID=A0ABS9A1M2_9GAMM|nr:hypothetical protein [Halomonas ethanolica]MCE8002718.1 hypothetical protein [Halomonas ethanolica]